MLCLRGLLGFSSITALFFALQQLPIADATVFTFLAPVYVSTVSEWLLGEDPGSRLPLVACVLGMLLVAQPGVLFGQARLPAHGVLLGLLHSIFSAAAKASPYALAAVPCIPCRRLFTMLKYQSRFLLVVITCTTCDTWHVATLLGAPESLYRHCIIIYGY
jgi:drug/metabolite transporter (DMT)-like permease